MKSQVACNVAYEAHTAACVFRAVLSTCWCSLLVTIKMCLYCVSLFPTLIINRRFHLITHAISSSLCLPWVSDFCFLYLTIVSPAVFIWERLSVFLRICPSKILHILLMIVLLKPGFLLWRSSDCLEKETCCQTVLYRLTESLQVCMSAEWLWESRCGSRQKRAQTVKGGLTVTLFGVFLHSRIMFDQEELLLTWTPGYF